MRALEPAQLAHAREWGVIVATAASALLPTNPAQSRSIP